MKQVIMSRMFAYHMPRTRSLAAFVLASTILAAFFPGAVSCQDLVGYDQVKDILRKRCLTCHNPDERRGDLDLKDLTAIKAGSDSGAVVVAGDSSASLLYTTVAHLDDPVMPPNSPRLPAREQDIIRRWIEGGLAEKSGSSNSAAEANVASTTTPAKDSKVVAEKPAMVSNQAKEADSTRGSHKSNSPYAPIRSLPQLTAIKAMDAHPSKDLMAIAGLRQVVLVESATSKLLGALDVDGDVTAIRFSRDGKLLLVGASQPAMSGTVIAFDADSAERLWTVGDETDSILGMDLSKDGKTLAVGGPTKTVRLYNVTTGEVMHSLKKHTDWVLDVCFSPDGLLLASGDRFGGIFVWDPKSGAVFQNLKDHVGAVHALAWDVSSETLLSGGEDGILRTWNLHHGELTSRWDAQVGAILAIARSADSTAAVGRKNALAVWSSPEVLKGKFALSDQGEVLARTADNRSWIVGDASGQVTVLNANELVSLSTIQLPTDASSIGKLIDRIDAEHATYLASNVKSEATKTESKISSAAVTKPTKVSELSPESSPSADAIKRDALGNHSRTVSGDASAATNVQALSIQLAASKEMIDQLQKSLQTSNQSLASLATLNNDLIKLVKQSSQIQAQLAEQVVDQANQLEQLQSRTQQLEAALKQATSVASPTTK